MIRFAAPTRFEIPLSWQTKVEHFGIGEARARRFAEALNQDHHEFERVVIFGAAGGLDPSLTTGQSFEISEIFTAGSAVRIPARTKLSQATLFTSQRVLATRASKELIYQQTRSQLVDMEMGFLWDSSLPEVREKLVFIRSVFDPAHSELTLNLRLPLELILNYRGYISGIQKALTYCDDTFHPLRKARE